MTPSIYQFMSVVGGFIWIIGSSYGMVQIHLYKDAPDTPANVARAILWPLFFIITLIVGTIHALYFVIKDAFDFRR